MTDVFDRATEREELERELSIAAARAVPALPYVGECYNCGQRLPQGMRFCDRDCCDDYERRRRAGKLV